MSVTSDADADSDNWPAIASLVCGVLTYVTPTGVVTAPLAVAFGISGRNRAREGAPHGTLATVGLALGAVAIALALVLAMVIAVLLIGSSTSSSIG